MAGKLADLLGEGQLDLYLMLRRGPFVQEEGRSVCSWEGRSLGGGNLGGSFTGGENNETIACQVVG